MPYLLYAILVLVGVGLGLYLFNQAQISKWRKQVRQHGDMVAIDGHPIFYRLSGQGPRTVIIECGLTTPSAEWWHIQDELAQYAQVLTYDRAGYGWSDPSRAPRTSRQIAVELNELLETVGLPGPFILVGHSQGGLYLNHFARLFPHKVAGVIFLDPLTPRDNEFVKRLSPTVFKQSGVDKTASMKMLAPLSQLGILRALKPMMMKAPPFYYYAKSMPARNIEAIWQDMLMPHVAATALAENAQAHIDQNNQDLLTPDGFPNVPVTVIYHTPEIMVGEIVKYGGLDRSDAESVERLWESLVKEYVTLGAPGTWIVSEGSSHFIHLDNTSLVIDEIKKLIGGNEIKTSVEA